MGYDAAKGMLLRKASRKINIKEKERKFYKCISFHEFIHFIFFFE